MHIVKYVFCLRRSFWFRFSISVLLKTIARKKRHPTIGCKYFFATKGCHTSSTLRWFQRSRRRMKKLSRQILCVPWGRWHWSTSIIISILSKGCWTRKPVMRFSVWSWGKLLSAGLTTTSNQRWWRDLQTLRLFKVCVIDYDLVYLAGSAYIKQYLEHARIETNLTPLSSSLLCKIWDMNTTAFVKLKQNVELQVRSWLS